MNMHPVTERFLRYVKINTQSNLDNAGKERPSSAGQIELMKLLVRELKELGVDDKMFVMCDDSSFLVCLPATQGLESAPHVAFAAHMDTYFSVSGEVNPQWHDYEGGDIELPKDNVVIPAKDLEPYKGCGIITSDGSSLLGADDKAGVAAMVTVIDQLLSEDIAHGPLTFWFCVDEEIGQLDVSVLPKELVESWDILWTVDGGEVGDIDLGCFICRLITLTFKGQDAHPGVDGPKMRPAHYAAGLFCSQIISEEPSPMATSGLEPFHYVLNMEGNASQAKVVCAPRSFDFEESELMSSTIWDKAKRCATLFDVEVEKNDNILCHNTRATIARNRHLLDPGFAAHDEYSLKPKEEDVRGGTDGAMINMAYPDLPAPNMGTGAHNIHGLREFLVVDQFLKVPQIMLSMIKRYTDLTL